MDYVDIRLCIFEHINDVKNLFNLCIVDKLAINMASTKAFWTKEFKKFRLTQPLITYNDYHRWMMAFLQCKYVKYKTTNIINRIQYPEIQTIKIDFNMTLDKYINILKRRNYGGLPPDNINYRNIILDEICLGKGIIKYNLQIIKNKSPLIIYLFTNEELKRILYDIYNEKCRVMSIKQLIYT